MKTFSCRVLRRVNGSFLTQKLSNKFPKCKFEQISQIREFSPKQISQQSDESQQSNSPLEFRGVKAFRSNQLKLDFANVRIGESLDIPYEMTISDTWRDTWQSVFYQQSRLYTSQRFINSIKKELPNISPNRKIDNIGVPMPFSLVLFLASSMSHVDDQRVVLDLSFKNCIYERPVFPGDTLNNDFKIDNIRESRNGKNIIVDIKCKLFNQYNEMVFHLIKTMFYEKLSINSNSMKLPIRDETVALNQDNYKWINGGIGDLNIKSQNSQFERFLIKSQHKLPVSTSLKHVYPNEILLHSMQRPLGSETNMMISTMHRMTHPALYNSVRYKEDELVVAGVCSIALIHAMSNKELFEILYEELHDAQMINKCNPNECVGALTYIHNVRQLSSVLEEVECTTLGVKNCDITQELDGVKIPIALFEPALKPSQIEEVCKDCIPQLRNKIVVQSTRRLIRKLPSDKPLALL